MSPKIQHKLDEQELVALLKKKSQDGFDYLYDNYSSALMGVALRVVQDRENAEEVVHDSFLKIWNSIDGYEVDKGRLFTWMARICKNASLDKVKSKNYKKNQKTDSILNVVSENRDDLKGEMNVDTIGVVEWMKALTADQKLVFDSLYFQGMSHSEAAEELEIPLGTVKTRLRLGLIEIRKNLGLS